MTTKVLALPTLEELKTILYQGDEEAVVLRLMDKCSCAVLLMIRDRIMAEREGYEPPTALSGLIKDQDMVDALTLAIDLKKLAERRRSVGAQVMPEHWRRGL
ncbi:MAG: hypothetical protein A2Z11_03335 [Candidatus Woykebacteria bacterium RBG_16_43_9]|uniref:Uncharacterized protein n=1 Tax=Candidatus Woykebacteria bacterium RBG_16_43_9 TaxID=1802596 RepID=A0A1G1WI54_9BACT|nr:MAG: hypothetical protein A2Z11_03335 [Candidatus Woykebacteria bacterium RBG_16_43_9]